MKFGKSIGTQQEENTSLHYIEYKHLKKRIKDVVVCLKDNELSEALNTNTAFEQALSCEIQQVNDCFARRQNELLDRTTELSEELHLSEGGSSSSSCPAMEEKQGGSSSCGGPSDAFERLVEVLSEVDQLRKYAVWNAVAVVKILKKRRKRTSFGIEDTAAERGGWLARQTFFSGSDFAELHAAVESLGHAIVLKEIGPKSFGAGTLGRREEEEAVQCPICLETISDMVELECRHRFCWKCFVLGPIAFQPQEYRMTQCPICRKDTATSSSYSPLKDLGAIGRSKLSLTDGEGFPGDVSMSQGDWQSSEGILSRFLHTYFPSGGIGGKGEELDSDDDNKSSQGRSEPECRDVVSELVKALYQDGGNSTGLGKSGAPTDKEAGSSSAVGSSSGGDFFQTLPPAKTPQEKQQLGQAQKLQWLQLASTNDPLEMHGTMYCSLCSEPLLMEAVVTTPCKHHFHRICIQRLDMPHCPLCNTTLPFSWFLPSDHHLAETGFRVVEIMNYKPRFPGGPSRGSCGFPLHQPPPMSLLGPDGLVMKSYLHKMVPTGDEEDDEDRNSPTFSRVTSGEEVPVLAKDDEEGSSASESSSDESNSDDGADEDVEAIPRTTSGHRSKRAEKRFAFSALGRMLLVDEIEYKEPPPGAFAEKAVGSDSEAGGSDPEPEQRNPQVLLIGKHL